VYFVLEGNGTLVEERNFCGLWTNKQAIDFNEIEILWYYLVKVIK
jgi:hypothetical protein